MNTEGKLKVALFTLLASNLSLRGSDLKVVLGECEKCINILKRYPNKNEPIGLVLISSNTGWQANPAIARASIVDFLKLFENLTLTMSNLCN